MTATNKMKKEKNPKVILFRAKVAVGFVLILCFGLIIAKCKMSINNNDQKTEGEYQEEVMNEQLDSLIKDKYPAGTEIIQTGRTEYIDCEKGDLKGYIKKDGFYRPARVRTPDGEEYMFIQIMAPNKSKSTAHWVLQYTPLVQTLCEHAKMGALKRPADYPEEKNDEEND